MTPCPGGLRQPLADGAEVEAVEAGPQAISEMIAAPITRRRTMLFTTFRDHLSGLLAENCTAWLVRFGSARRQHQYGVPVRASRAHGRYAARIA